MPVLRSKRVKKDRAKKTLEFIDAKNEDKRTKRKLTETDARKKTGNSTEMCVSVA